MDTAQLLHNLRRPTGKVDVVLDTDTYNEIDDQYALAYLVRSPERADLKAVYAAPFYNSNSKSPEDGMERSYDEILHILSLCGRDDLHASAFKGSRTYMPDEKTPVVSPAAEDLCLRAMDYSPERPLYVIAIGAITNIASALVLKPEIAEKIVLIWLGGHSFEWPDTKEFNMYQDVAAARVVFGCGAPVVQLPCMGVVSAFTSTKPELEYWLRGKNALCDYLIDHTIEEAESYAAGRPWSRVIWDVTAVAWLLDEHGTLVSDRLTASPIPQYDHHYSFDPGRHFIKYVFHIHRDALMEDLIKKLTR
ncbi:MAG: nucleoside hydrolase [Eubacteriales bacterium]